MVDVRNAVCKGDDCPLERHGVAVLGMVQDAVPHFDGEVEALAVLFEDVYDAQRLLGVVEPRGAEVVEHPLPHMPEGSVAEVVPQGDGLRQILIEGEAAGDGAGDLGDIEGVREPRHVVVPVGREKDLRLILEAQERFGIDNSIPVPLEIGAHGTRPLLPKPPPRVFGELGVGREEGTFFLIGLFFHR